MFKDPNTLQNILPFLTLPAINDTVCVNCSGSEMGILNLVEIQCAVPEKSSEDDDSLAVELHRFSVCDQHSVALLRLVVLEIRSYRQTVCMTCLND